MADDEFDPTSLLQQIFEIDRKMDGLKDLARRTSLADAAVAVSVARKNWASHVISNESIERIEGELERCDTLRHILDDARIVLLEVAERCMEASVPPAMFSERDAYELLRIRAIVREEASIRHGDLPGEPSWGVVADSVLAHTSQHRLARDLLKVPANLTLDQHVSLLLRRPTLDRNADDFRRLADQAREELKVRPCDWGTGARSVMRAAIVVFDMLAAGTAIEARADGLEADMLALRSAYLEASGTNATLVELVGAVRRGADPEVERLRIDVQHYREVARGVTAKRIEELELEVARLTGELAAAPCDPGNAIAFAEYQAARKAETAEIEQIAIQTAIAVLEELAPRADAKALVRTHYIGRQVLRVVVAANLAADVLAVLETAIGGELSDRVSELSIEREPGRPPDGYTVEVDGEFTEHAGGGKTWGWDLDDEHGGVFETEAAAIDDAWRDFGEIVVVERSE